MGARRAFYRPSQIKFKTEKLQFSKLYYTQNKHILKIMKEVFVHSIYSSRYMDLGFENHLYKHYGRHFSKPIFTDLHYAFTKQNCEFRHSFQL